LRRECVAGVSERVALAAIAASGGVIPPAICESFWGEYPSRNLTFHPVVATPVELAFGGQGTNPP